MAVSTVSPRSINSDPAVAAYVITPSDTVDLATGPCRAVYVGVTGDITMTVLQASGGVVSWQPVLFKAVLAGAPLSVGCARVNNTGTTATNLVALY